MSLTRPLTTVRGFSSPTSTEKYVEKTVEENPFLFKAKTTCKKVVASLPTSCYKSVHKLSTIKLCSHYKTAKQGLNNIVDILLICRFAVSCKLFACVDSFKTI